MKLIEILKSDTNALKLFSSQQIQQLEASLFADDKNEKFYLNCLRRKRKIQVYSPSKTNPEEIIRQLYILKLNQEYGYPIENMELEVSVQMGSASKSADIVIYDNASKKDKENIVLIIEVKKPNESLTQGIDQLESYISALPTYLGVWVDGLEENIRYRNPDNKYKFERFKRLPKFNETVADVLATYLKKQDLLDVQDLRATVNMLQEKVLANDGVNAFDEIFKLIFAKLYDEQSKKPLDELEFQTKKGTKLQPAVEALFSKAKLKWKDVFKDKEELELSEETLIAVVSELQEYKLLETDFEILDAAFEHMISGDSKGEKGQYFTPRPVIDIIVQLLNPHDDERVLDPSAGSAGFLLHTFQHMLNEKKLIKKTVTAMPSITFLH
jgi:type I restriction enzyme M protein